MPAGCRLICWTSMPWMEARRSRNAARASAASPAEGGWLQPQRHGGLTGGAPRPVCCQKALAWGVALASVCSATKGPMLRQLGLGREVPGVGSGPGPRGLRLLWRKAKRSFLQRHLVGQLLQQGENQSAGKWSSEHRGRPDPSPRKRSRRCQRGSAIDTAWVGVRKRLSQIIPARPDRSADCGDSRQQLQGLLQIGLQIGEVFAHRSAPGRRQCPAWLSPRPVPPRGSWWPGGRSGFRCRPGSRPW